MFSFYLIAHKVASGAVKPDPLVELLQSHWHVFFDKVSERLQLFLSECSCLITEIVEAELRVLFGTHFLTEFPLEGASW